jgi:hypothetical protein
MTTPGQTPVYRNDVAAYIALEIAQHALERAALTAPDLADDLEQMVEWLQQALDTVFERMPPSPPVTEAAGL